MNRKQAIFITAKSETPEATEITIEIIERFDAYERGAALPPPDAMAASVASSGPMGRWSVGELQGKARIVELYYRLYGPLGARHAMEQLGFDAVPAGIAKAAAQPDLPYEQDAHA